MPQRPTSPAPIPSAITLSMPLAELQRRTPFLALKMPVKVMDAPVTASVSDLGNGIPGLGKQPADMPQPDLIQTLRIGLPHPRTEAPAERPLGHTGLTRHLLQRHRAEIVRLHQGHHLVDPTFFFSGRSGTGDRRRRQDTHQMVLTGIRKLV